ncbi:hypothetical protein VTJ83DRAFT_5667 [Remersonia thermophila]|uniref:Rhomboid family membrane protein n=1 Tax=Remersonia thermophila TaxID=72144 RepID=A0ABR4D7L2_9PEZI
MSSSDPPSSSPSPTNKPESELPERNPILHNAALGLAVLAPIGLVLPSRGKSRFNLQNALLGGTAFWAFNQLAHDYTGKSITARSSERWGALLGISPKDKEAAAAEEEAKNEKKKKAGIFRDLPTERAVRNKELIEAERRRRAEAEGREYIPREERQRGFWGRLWMGGEKEGWREKRLEEEKKALESGKGYGGLIVDQVKEVWEGWGSSKKDGEGGKEGGEGEGRKKD